MIKVTIIDNMQIIDSVFKNPTDGDRVAWAQENESILGYMLFNESGELKSVVDNDCVFELLVRSSLNHLDLNGVEQGFSYNADMEKELLLLGFKKENNRLWVNIKEFFKPCAGCR